MAGLLTPQSCPRAVHSAMARRPQTVHIVVHRVILRCQRVVRVCSDVPLAGACGAPFVGAVRLADEGCSG